jgi:hypothetical protein
MNRSLSSRFLCEATNQRWSRFLHEATGLVEKVGSVLIWIRIACRLNLRNHVRDLSPADIDGLHPRALALLLVVIRMDAALLPVQFIPEHFVFV